MTTPTEPHYEMPSSISPESESKQQACERSEVARPRGLARLDNRLLTPLLITGILLGGQFSYGMLESWSRTIMAIAASIACEMLIGRIFLRKYPNITSAYITGISVGILIRSPFFWPYPICAAASILSKYALRWRDRHLWNPSNFGVSVMLFLYPAAVASLSVQWGNALGPIMIIWLLGSIVIYRVNRFHISFAYVVSFVALSLIRSQMTGTPFFANVAPITGPMYQLFVFFMITDPKTTVKTKGGQCLVAVLVALVEMILRIGQVVHAPYFALFIVGPIANVISIARSGSSAPK